MRILGEVSGLGDDDERDDEIIGERLNCVCVCVCISGHVMLSVVIFKL